VFCATIESWRKRLALKEAGKERYHVTVLNDSINLTPCTRVRDNSSQMFKKRIKERCCSVSLEKNKAIVREMFEAINK